MPGARPRARADGARSRLKEWRWGLRDSDWAARIAAQQQRAQADSSQSDSIPSFDSDWLAPPPGTESQETIES